VVEYVEPSVESVLGADAASDPALADVLDVFRKFSSQPAPSAAGAAGDGAGGGAAASGGDDDSDGEGALLSRLPSGLSRKARKALMADIISELKRRVVRPESIEAHDATSADPELLVALKSARNSVPVPVHWCSKRRYLQGNAKRGVVKPPFALPDYLAATGIGALRELDNAADERKGLKGKTRERARPKMGRVEVDYKVLHDAFFVHMTKPKFTTYGDLYFEGREFEPDRSGFRAGTLSPRLRTALGISATDPPPWLVNMQRFGPPPSYMHMRVPGLNAPIPTARRSASAQGSGGIRP
jgi:splicing factor 3B subunit 2